MEYFDFSEPVVNVAKAFLHCFRSFDSAAGKLFFICSDIFGSDLFFAVRQLEGEALEELVHKKLLTTPPSCRVLSMRISMIIEDGPDLDLVDHNYHDDHDHGVCG